MLSKGNGDVPVCVNNLLRIVRNEVPYDRLRGLSSDPYDKPTDEAADELEQDALWCIETYEPRAEVEGVTVTQEDALNSGFSVKATII